MGQNDRNSSIIIILWIIIAIVLTIVSMIILETNFPIFVFFNLLLALFVIISRMDSRKLGIKKLPTDVYLKYTLLNLIGILSIYILIEPWSHIYAMLLDEAINQDQLDVTFGWIVEYDNLFGWMAMLLYSGFVSIFAEEVVFRGILLQYLKDKITESKAIILQAVIFTIPQSLVLFVFPFLEGILFILGYSIFAIGIIGGYTASKTDSIYPSLTAATIANFVMSLVILL